MHAIFNENPYKFWTYGIKVGTYLLVTNSDDCCKSFEHANPYSYETPPYTCGDGLFGDNYARRIWDWYDSFGGDVRLHLGFEHADDTDEYKEWVASHDEISRIESYCNGIVAYVKEGVHHDDFFDLLYDLYDYEVEEIHYECEE